jgi:hypothetical protein
MKIIFRVCILIFLFSNNAIHLQAQPKDNLRRQAISQVLFKGCYFSFYLSPYLAEKAKTVMQSGNYSIHSTYAKGLEAGGNLFINFNKKYSLITGLHAGFSGRNAALFVPKADFNPNLKTDANMSFAFARDYDLYLTLPIWFEKRWSGKKFDQWNLDAGVNVRYYPDDIFYIYNFWQEDVNDQYVQVFSMDGEVGNNYALWLNYNIGGGYSFFLSNYNFLRINVIANLSAKKIANFNYSITVSGKPESTGTYSANLSYIGISLNYIFTGANKKLVKLYKEKF